jgi:hypothetical protein
MTPWSRPPTGAAPHKDTPMGDIGHHVPLSQRPGNPAHLLPDEQVNAIIDRIDGPFGERLRLHLMEAERQAFEAGKAHAQESRSQSGG